MHSKNIIRSIIIIKNRDKINIDKRRAVIKIFQSTFNKIHYSSLIMPSVEVFFTPINNMMKLIPNIVVFGGKCKSARPCE